jgi:hypothetical protein
MRNLLRDERGVIGSWFARLAVTTAIVGVILFDAGAIAVNFFGLDATADDVAVGVANFAKSSSGAVTAPLLEEQAKQLAKEADARLIEFGYDAVERRITITLRREANTFIVSRISTIEDWGKATAESHASTQ